MEEEQSLSIVSEGMIEINRAIQGEELKKSLRGGWSRENTPPTNTHTAELFVHQPQAFTLIEEFP